MYNCWYFTLSSDSLFQVVDAQADACDRTDHPPCGPFCSSRCQKCFCTLPGLVGSDKHKLKCSPFHGCGPDLEQD